jgi:hypothetical protein
MVGKPLSCLGLIICYTIVKKAVFGNEKSSMSEVILQVLGHISAQCELSGSRPISNFDTTA